MAIELVPSTPTLPFLRINKYQAKLFLIDDQNGRKSYEMSFSKMLESAFKDGRFKEDAYIIDINGWKFPIRDVENLGRSWSCWDIFWDPFTKWIKVKYAYDTPIQLTFDEAREEIVELICRKRWFSKTQDRESQKSFRARMAKCENMRDLIVGRRDPDPKGTYIGGISFYGEWVG